MADQDSFLPRLCKHGVQDFSVFLFNLGKNIKRTSRLERIAAAQVVWRQNNRVAGTQIEVSPLHLVYDTVCRAALKRGQKVTGTELIGLAPKASLVEAGRYFLLKEGENPRFFKEEELISYAMFKMRLDELPASRPRRTRSGGSCRGRRSGGSSTCPRSRG